LILETVAEVDLMELMLDFLQEELIGVEVYMEEFVRRLLRADGCYLDHYLME
jgi:hypothetical protein